MPYRDVAEASSAFVAMRQLTEKLINEHNIHSDLIRHEYVRVHAPESAVAQRCEETILKLQLKSLSVQSKVGNSSGKRE